MIRHLFHFTQNVTGYKHCNPLLRETPDQFSKLLYSKWIETIGRLIKYEETGMRDQRRRNSKALFHPE